VKNNLLFWWGIIYKNKKNFINPVLPKTDFGTEAEWHFFETSHGKGPCDDVAVVSNAWQHMQVYRNHRIIKHCHPYIFIHGQRKTSNLSILSTFISVKQKTPESIYSHNWCSATYTRYPQLSCTYSHYWDFFGGKKTLLDKPWSFQHSDSSKAFPSA
jgi:hypothetical protein